MARELIRMTLRQSYQSKNISNVFYYHVDSDDDDKAKRVAQAFELQMLNPINQVQNLGVVNVEGYALNLSNQADYWTEAYTGSGLIGVTQNGNPPYMSLAFTLNPTASLIRHGYKRFTGVDESFVSTGKLANSFLPEVNALANAIANGLTLGPLYPAVPVIARILSVDPQLVYIFANVAGCVFKAVSTQNTRKV